MSQSLLFRALLLCPSRHKDLNHVSFLLVYVLLSRAGVPWLSILAFFRENVLLYISYGGLGAFSACEARSGRYQPVGGLFGILKTTFGIGFELFAFTCLGLV